MLKGHPSCRISRSARLPMENCGAVRAEKPDCLLYSAVCSNACKIVTDDCCCSWLRRWRGRRRQVDKYSFAFLAFSCRRAQLRSVLRTEWLALATRVPMKFGHPTAVGIQHFRHALGICSVVPQSTPLKSVRLLAQHW